MGNKKLYDLIYGSVTSDEEREKLLKQDIPIPVPTGRHIETSAEERARAEKFLRHVMEHGIGN